MLILTPRPKPRWQTITIAPEVTIDVELTPPTLDALIAEKTTPHPAEAVTIRLASVTNWRDVVAETADGGTVAVPFAPDKLADLIRSYDTALDALLGAVRPLFVASGDREKNSVAPPAAATSPNPPSNASSSSVDSPTSPAPSGSVPPS